jgi:protein-disulfide isomerase
MTIRALRGIVLAATIASLALASCSKQEEGGAGLTGAQIAKVAPPAGKAWSDIAAKTVEGGYLMGNPNAAIKLIEYGSLSCPACAQLGKTGFPKLISEYVNSGRVSFEFRSFAIHGQDVPLNTLAECGAPEAFIPLAEQIYQNFDALNDSVMKGQEQAQKAMSLPENQRFVAFAQATGLTDFFAARGLAKDQANACLADISRATAFAARTEKFSKDGVNQTPTLMVNGNKVDGGTWVDLEAALQRAGAR